MTTLSPTSPYPTSLPPPPSIPIPPSAFSLPSRLLLSLLSAGPIPQHIAFVMDGNRRYARTRHLPVSTGHTAGFTGLRRVLELCMRLGVRCVSVYAFSIENFGRPREEVDALMGLAREKLTELARHGDLIHRHNIRVSLLGRTSLLPPDVLATMREIEDLTRDNDGAILNICCPYTSRDEMTTAVSSYAGELFPKPSFAQSLSTARSPPLDILVRTSGVHRLSDFLMWQVSQDNASLHFVDTYWPDIGLWDMVPIVLEWQRRKWTEEVATKEAVKRA